MISRPADVLVISGDADLAARVGPWCSPADVITASACAAGLARLAEGSAGAVLLVPPLPDSADADAVRRLRAQAPHLPILVLGRDDEDAVLELLRAGADDYLDCDGLDATQLRRAVGRAAARQQGPGGSAATAGAESSGPLSATVGLLDSILASCTQYGLYATDLDGVVVAWNEGARRNSGYTAAEVVGRLNVRQLYTEGDVRSGAVQALFDTALASGKAEGVFERVRKDGTHFTGLTVLTVRRDAAGRPVGFLTVSRDISDQRALEEELRRKNEALEEQSRRAHDASRFKSEFLANMSHELRTPLNSILGFAELMHDGKVGPVSAEHKEYLGDILSSGRHLLELINDVLDLAKVEAGAIELRPELVRLDKVVGEVCSILRPLAARKRTRVESRIDPDLGPVVIDPGKLKQVLYNYLSNALKFTPEGGRVEIRIGPDAAGTFRVEVEDNGIGVRPEDLDRLFVEFQQLDAGASKRYPGTGLGLALTRRLVQAQGGRVGVRSTPGQGSVFSAVLPQAAVAVAPTPARPARAGAPTVLVVEDDPHERAWLTEVLAGAGYAVETACDGAEALAMCEARAFDAITLDLLLPDVGNRELLRAIQAQGPNRNVPVIILTVVAERGAVAGFSIHDFLVKPVAVDELLASLQRAGVPPEKSNKVLVVDDDANALKLMDATLQHLGYQPILRGDGAAGLAACASEAPAAVILDLLMPGMDGFEFLDRFRRTAAGRRTPVIVWTVKALSAEDQVRLRAMAEGVVGKGQGRIAWLLDELRRHLGTPPGSGSAPDAEREG